MYNFSEIVAVTALTLIDKTRSSLAFINCISLALKNLIEQPDVKHEKNFEDKKNKVKSDAKIMRITKLDGN